MPKEFLGEKISLEEAFNQEEILLELGNYLGINSPSFYKIRHTTDVIPRFLYFKFLKDDEEFALELVRLYVEAPPSIDIAGLDLEN